MLEKLAKRMMGLSDGKGATFSASGRLAKVPVPGGEAIDLPAGAVTVHYQDQRKVTGKMQRREFFRPPGDLEVSIRPAGGTDVLQLDRPSGHIYQWGPTRDDSYGRYQLGTVEVLVAGTYDVDVRGTPAPEARSAAVLLD